MTKKRVKEIQSSGSANKPKPRVNGAKKGKQFERDIAQQIGHIFPEAERLLEYQASSVVGIDIQGTDKIKIQCKNYANYCPIGKIGEIKIKDPNDIPVLVTKGIRMEPMAVLPFQKLVTLLEIAYGLSPQWATIATSTSYKSQSIDFMTEKEKEVPALDLFI